MGEVRAQLDVLESCAIALHNEGTSAGPAADALGGAAPGANSAGTTPASAELVASTVSALDGAWDGAGAEAVVGYAAQLRAGLDAVGPGHGDIWNPVDNIIAGVRYSISRYGSVSNVPGVVGVRSGGGYSGY